MMWEYGMGWGWGWFGMILFWLVPILLIALVLKFFLGAVSVRTQALAMTGKGRWTCWKKDMLGEKSIARSTYRNATI